MSFDTRMSAAQRSFDNQMPVEYPENYLDTDHGQEWLDTAAQELLDGHSQVWATGSLKIHRRTHGVTVADLEQAMVGTTEADHLHSYAHLIATGAKSPDSEFDLICSNYKAAALQTAKRLLGEHAAARAEYEIELAADDGPW